MEISEIRKKLIMALTHVAPEAQDEELRYSENLQDQLDLDSVDVLNYIIKAQELFKVEIPNSEYRSFLTIDGGAQVILSKFVDD